MAENSSSDASNSLFSMNSLLTLVTILGGIVLVSHKLSSDRPKRTNPEGTRPLGTQNIESRLWEDPFAAWEKLDESERQIRNANGLDVLRTFLTEDPASAKSSRQLVLGVMVSGQPYAEDQESRIRTRYAVGAALGTGGYKPEEAGHIGLAAGPWPSSKDLVDWKPTCTGLLGVTTNASENASNLCRATEEKLVLRVPFEEYKKREFFPSDEYSKSSNPVGQAGPRYDRVLLLWLDEEYFEDDPATRLALLLNQIIPPDEVTEQKLDRVIIGPRASDTLRTLVSSVGKSAGHSNFWTNVVSTLKPVRLILATPTAMDEVLVPPDRVCAADFIKPRQALVKVLQHDCLFASVKNFACTDKQLAEETLQELKLRGVDPAKPSDHVVLISEWDSFHARMSGLALAAELSIGQHDSSNVFHFTEQVRAGTNLWPNRLHRFVYLQGLDGEAAETEESLGTKSQKEEVGEGTTSLEDLANELAKLKPEVNKAEGAAQFDYLNRLGDVITTLNKTLWRRDHARVAAVGIIGSDVYDTLLILQALRPRLPDAVFFTSDLDARFWDPEELKWTRNLVVLSGYGLELVEQLQTGVAPFRDSQQCAEFLSTLEALCDWRMTSVDAISPRRFEIARGGPVDLSTNDNIWPHPQTRVPPDSLVRPLALAVGIFAAAALLFWKPLRLLAFPSREYCCEPLTVSPEDFGTTEDVDQLLTNLESKRHDPLGNWLLDNDVSSAVPKKEKESAKEGITIRLKPLIRRCNNLIFADRSDLLLPDANVLEKTLLLNTEHRRSLLENLNRVTQQERLCSEEIYANRRAINYILDQLRGQPAGQGGAAYTAQQISLLRYNNRRWRPCLFWLTAILLGCGLLVGAWLSWRDTYVAGLGGEPFNVRGTSAWPAELIRFSVFGLSVLVIIRTQRRLGQSILEITRRYRLDLDAQSSEAKMWRFWMPEPPLTDAEVDANILWSEYRRTRHWKGRLLRVLACLAIYLCFAGSLSQVTHPPFSPIRGNVLGVVDPLLLICSVLALLFVTFWMIDAAQSCAWFIRRLSLAPTRYPKETVRHFKHQRAIEDEELVEEWIDLQLVADLTEPVGQLVYWPFISVLLMLVARNSWFDQWPWHWPLLVIFGLNIILAASSSIILQRAARKAQEIGVQRLKEKANRKQRDAAATVREHESNQANQLLEEINGLRRGAFAPWSQNPLVGALLVNSSGLVLLELLPLFFSK